MYGADRTKNRRVSVEAWRKAQAGEPLTDMEARLADLIGQHPEYHGAFRDDEDALLRDWLPEGGEANPFMHISLHLALLEQLALDQPAGLRKAFTRLIDSHFGDTHAAEHTAMECLAEALWLAQREGREFRPKGWLKCIRRRTG